MLLRRGGEVRNRRIGRNVPLGERVASLAVGTAALLAGARRGSLGGTALGVSGAALAMRGLTGRCAVYRHRALANGVEARRTVLIPRSRRELYRALRRIDRLPLFLSQITEIVSRGDGIADWVIGRGPDAVRFTTTTFADVIDRRIAWESVPGSPVVAHGSIELSEASDGGTIVDITLSYRPAPGLLIARGVQKLFDGFTGRRLASDLIQLRTLLLAGAFARPAEAAPAAKPLGNAARPPIPGPWPLRAMDSGLRPVRG